MFKKNISKCEKFLYMGDFQSGQMGQTVNLLSMTSVVRIHHLPPNLMILFFGISFYFLRTDFNIFILMGGVPNDYCKVISD